MRRDENLWPSQLQLWETLRCCCVQTRYMRDADFWHLDEKNNGDCVKTSRELQVYLPFLDLIMKWKLEFILKIKGFYTKTALMIKINSSP